MSFVTMFLILDSSVSVFHQQFEFLFKAFSKVSVLALVEFRRRRYMEFLFLLLAPKRLLEHLLTGQ